MRNAVKFKILMFLELFKILKGIISKNIQMGLISQNTLFFLWVIKGTCNATLFTSRPYSIILLAKRFVKYRQRRLFALQKACT